MPALFHYGTYNRTIYKYSTYIRTLFPCGTYIRTILQYSTFFYEIFLNRKYMRCTNTVHYIQGVLKKGSLDFLTNET